MEVLQELYPDRWDIQIITPDWFQFHEYEYPDEDKWRYLNCYKWDHSFNSFKGNVEIYFTIFYPEITITNRNKAKHLIKELYAQIRFNLFAEEDTIELYGTRGLVTAVELLSNYGHSHLNNFKHGFGKFCLGESEFGTVFKSEFITTDKNSIRQVLFLLDAYLEYESIEGVPHHRMEQCVIGKDLKNIKIPNWLFNSIKTIPIPIKLNKSLQITNFSEIEEALCKYEHLLSGYMCYKAKNKYYSRNVSSNNSNISDYKDSVLGTFKNQQIKLKIENYETGEIKKYPHPTLTRETIKYWEGEIFKTYIRNHRVERENTTAHTQESVAAG